MATIEQFVIEGLGHQSYCIIDEESGMAAVVDPQRDVSVYLEAAQHAGVRISHILETHIHNDYISGACELAACTRATIVASALDPPNYAHYAVHEGDRFSVGQLIFQALATPGHTLAHTSYLLYEPGSERPSALFSGGSLLAGNAGRTDLMGEEMTIKLTYQQYQSLRRLLDELPEQVRVYPTHSTGSFCMSAVASSAPSTTIAQERLVNPAAQAKSEDEFVQQQLMSYTVYPTYYCYLGQINRAGPRILGTLPQPMPLSPREVKDCMQQGRPLLDVRKRDDFVREHIPGSLNIELGAQFATYVGWLLPFNTPLLILVEDEVGCREAVTQLLRIGYEQVEGYLNGGIAAWKAAALPTDHFESISIETLYKYLMLREEFTLVDVRRPDEWVQGHIPGALHIHLGDLPEHIEELPKDRRLVVICHTGYRAGIAASMLAASGHEVAVVRNGMGDWLKSGLPFVTCEDTLRSTTVPLDSTYLHP
jgi:hydroxyacylglutathione hydrolase